MANILDDICEPGPLLTPETIKPPNISKATIQRCISKLSPYWSDEQLDQVVEMFQANGLLSAPDLTTDKWSSSEALRRTSNANSNVNRSAAQMGWTGTEEAERKGEWLEKWLGGYAEMA